MATIHIRQVLNPEDVEECLWECEDYDHENDLVGVLERKYEEYLKENFPEYQHIVTVMCSAWTDPYSEFSIRVENPDEDPENMRMALTPDLWELYIDSLKDFS